VDQTDAFGLGAHEHLEPAATRAGPVAVAIDWAQVELVWSAHGYPVAPAYRDTHRRTYHDRTPWANHGGPYDVREATALAREHAREFVAHAAARLDAYSAERPGRRGLLACALDTELLGHWWYEGPTWLAAVVEEADRQGVTLATLGDALERAAPVERPLAPSTWGQPKDMSTWDSALVAGPAFDARRREVELVLAASRGRDGPALMRATRELLALQASDWSFQLTRRLAADYPLRRMAGHAERMDAALAALADSAPAPEPEVRNLAPELDLSPLVAP
jgi:1,4-alpha-glucan branching enzyme